MPKKIQLSMFLRPTSITEIVNTIKQLNPNKSSGSDGIDAKFIICAANILASVSNVINVSFDKCQFPIRHISQRSKNC